MSSFGPPGGGEGTRVVRDDASQWEIELSLHGKPDDVNISGMAFSYSHRYHDCRFVVCRVLCLSFNLRFIIYHFLTVVLTVNHQTVLI